MATARSTLKERSPPAVPAGAPGGRIARLIAMVTTSGPVRLREAAQALGVSEMTVRRDLAVTDTLVCLGGYVAIAGAPLAGADYVLDREQRTHMAGKRAAAEAAARRVQSDETIFIDCGTTMPFLAAALPHDIPLTVVCYALNIATIVCRRPGTRVIMLGGFYYESSASFWSRESEDTLARLGIDRAFISAGGIHRERGVSCSSFHEVPLKQAAMARAEESCLVADATKFNQVKPAYFADVEAFDRIVTDKSLGVVTRKRFTGLRPVLETAALRSVA